MNHATACVLLSDAIYKDYPFDQMQKLGFKPGKIIERAAECAWVVPSGRRVHVVFRGTENAAEWGSNFNASKRPIFGYDVKVHYGFLSGLLNIYNPIMAELSRVGGSDKNTLVISGHSRGAAFAQLFALKAYKAGYDIEEIHLFGSPRALTKAAATEFNFLFPGKCWRWLNNNDAVTRIPPAWMGFRHAGTEMYFNSAGKYAPTAGAWIKAREQVWGRVKALLRLKPLDGAADHSISAYVKCLRRYMCTHTALPRRQPQIKTR